MVGVRRFKRERLIDDHTIEAINIEIDWQNKERGEES